MCGWGPGQLESECTAGVWFTAAASASLVLDADAAGAELWHKVRAPITELFKGRGVDPTLTVIIPVILIARFPKPV